MSAYHILIGHPHKGGSPVVIAGPEIPYAKQREKFQKEFQGVRSHKDFRQVDLLDSRSGISKRTTLISPAELKKRDEAKAKDEKAFSEKEDLSLATTESVESE